MWFAVTKGEQKLSELAARLYRIEAPNARAKAKAAADALLEANPHLEELKQLPAGTEIVVPEVPDLEVTAEARPAETAAGGTLVDELRTSLAAAGAALTAAVDEHDRRSTAMLDVLGSKEVKKAAADSPDTKERAASVTDAVKAEQKDAAALRAYHEQVAAQVERDLDELLKALS
jgi:phage tail protein X